MPHLQYLLGGGKSGDAKYASLKAQHDNGSGGATDAGKADEGDDAGLGRVRLGGHYADRNGNVWRVGQTRMGAGFRPVFTLVSGTSPTRKTVLNLADFQKFVGPFLLGEEGTGIDLAGDRRLNQTETDNLFGHLFGGAGGGGGGAGGGGRGGGGASAPAYSSTRQAAQEAMAFERQQAEANRRFQAEQAERDRLIREREQKLDIARSLAAEQMRGREVARQQAVDVIREPDPFAFTALARGQAVDFTTPQQMFAKNLTNFANAPVPLPGEAASVAQLDQMISQLQQQQRPPQNRLGFAGGGTVGMGGAQQGGAGVAIMVGEGDMSGGEEPEILHLKPDGTIEVIPMVGQAAAGAELDWRNLGGFRNLFANLRASANLPRTFFSFNQPSVKSTPKSVSLGRLGARETPLSGDPSRDIPVGGRPPAAFEAFGGTLAITPGLRNLGKASGQPFSKSELHNIAGLTVGVLPAPFKIANFFNRLLPDEQNVVLRAYMLAGVPEESFRSLIQAPMLRGQERSLIGLG